MSKKGKVLVNKGDVIKRSWFARRLLGSLPLKTRASNRNAFYKAFRKVRDTHKVNPFAVIALVAHSIKPDYWIRLHKKGKRESRIPYRLLPLQKYRYSVRWLARAIKERPEKLLEDKISSELSHILNGTSKIFQWKANLDFAVKRNRHNVRYKQKKEFI